MKISIITPVYNGEKYIEECIKSVKKQKYKDYEHIIIDGGSTDKTVSIIKRYEGLYNMKYISESDNGMYDAICKGFSLANGEIFAWLNADDMYMDDAFERVNTVFENNRNVSWITGIPQNYDKNGVVYYIPRIFPVYFQSAIALGFAGVASQGIQQESTFWRKELWEKSNGAEVLQKYRLAGDYWLWVSFAKYAKLYTVDVTLSGFRRHEGQLSGNIKKYIEEIGKISSFKSKVGRYVINPLQQIACLVDSKNIIHLRPYYERK